MQPDEAEFAARIGRRVTEARRQRGWTQAQLAEAIGIEPTTLSRLETGKRPFALGLLFRIARRLGLNPSAFLDDHEVTTPGLAPDEEALLAIWRSLKPPARASLLHVAREMSTAARSMAAEP